MVVTTELRTCPRRKIGKMSAIGLAAAISRDYVRKRMTDDLRGHKCNNYGYPKGIET
jgi:hypothetical protein